MAKEIIQQDIAKVRALVQKVLGEADYAAIGRMGGLTNHTYHVTMADGSDYVVRIPGDGTEEMIDRNDEKKSTTLACQLGVDAEMLYFGEDGSKVTRYIPNAITMSSETLKEQERIDQMADIFRKLHTCGQDTGVPFEVFDMAQSYEKIIADKNVPMYDDYEAVKATVMDIKAQVDASADIPKVPCHNDALCENWVVGDGKMYLIDWEYAGMNDGMWDLADVSIEAGFDAAHDLMFLRSYLEREPETKDLRHFLASKLYVDYLWTLWAKARVPYDGQPMEDWATERYGRLKENIKAYQAI